MRCLLLATVATALLAGTAMPVSAAPGETAEGERKEQAREPDGSQAARATHESAVSGGLDPSRRLAATAREYAFRRQLARSRTALGTAEAIWEPLGPRAGAGRMTAVAFHPAEPATVYAGAASGGLFRTTDGGASWEAITDELPNLTVGALAVAPSAPATIYVGTGEGSWPGLFLPGIGLVTSTDGGATWRLPVSVVAERFFRISVHPQKPAVLVAGTDAGGLRSTDGGATFTEVISRARYGLVTEVLRDPTRPETLYASTWCPGAVTCQAGAARILRSQDDGLTWVERSSGISFDPEAPRENQRIALAISATSPRILYAACGKEQAGVNISHVFKTTDAGESWQSLPAVSQSSDPSVRGYMVNQSWYDNAIAVSPYSSEVVVAGGVQIIRSTDGGRSFARAPLAGTDVHRDVHDLRYQGRTLWIATDGGLYTASEDGGTAAERNAGLATRQYHALALDPARPDRILAGAMDNGTDRAVGGAFRPVVGLDGFDCAVSPASPDIAYATSQYGKVYRSPSVWSAEPAFHEITPGYEAAGERPPFATVLAMDEDDPRRLLTGAARVWESRDGASFSPLPTATADGSTWNDQPVTAIALARGAPGVVMVAKSPDVYRSTDGGRTWVRASRGLTGQRINGLETDPRSPSVAWAAVASASSSVFLTTDGGGTWTPRASGLPAVAAHSVRLDPRDGSVVLVGTDTGVYRSTDQGASWSRFGAGLPSVAVHDLRVLGDGTVVAATHGRGLWRASAPLTENHPPAAAIQRPSGPLTVPTGSVVQFTGHVSDPDAGDTAHGVWSFPDTSEIFTAAPGSSSVSHTFPRAGSFTVTLTARDARGGSAVASVPITVTSEASAGAAPQWLMAGVAYTGGAGGAFWQSDFAVFNPHATQELGISLGFLDGRAGAGADVRWHALTVAPRETLALTNVLGSAPLLLPKGSFGALLIRGDRVPAPPVLTGRTYNSGSPGGTFGLALAAVPLVSGLVALADPAPTELLVGLREVPGASRTNLALASVGAEPARARVALHGARGEPLGAPFEVELPPWGVRQLNRVLSAPPPEGAGHAAPASTFVARVTVLAGRVYPYATVIDERSSDPVMVAPTQRLASRYRLPGIVRTPGRGGTFFVSDVVLHNPAARARTVTLRYRFRVSRGGEAPSPEISVEKTLPLAAGETLELVDFVRSLVGPEADGASYTASILEVAADGAEPLVAAGRTYNAQPGGNVGFQVLGSTVEDGASAGGTSTLAIAGLTSNASYRTNVAFFLLGEGDVRGTVRVVDRGGRVVASRALALGPGVSFAQWNDADLFAQAGGGDGLAVVLDVEGGTAPVGAYATLIDNLSGDAVLVPGQVN